MLGYLGAHCRVSWCPHHGAALILRALLSLLLMAASRCLSLRTQVTSLRAALAKCSSTKVAAAAARPPHTTRKVTCRGVALVCATLSLDLCCSHLHVHKLEDLVLGPRPAATQRHEVKLDTEGHGRSHEVTLCPRPAHLVAQRGELLVEQPGLGELVQHAVELPPQLRVLLAPGEDEADVDRGELELGEGRL